MTKAHEVECMHTIFLGIQAHIAVKFDQIADIISMELYEFLPCVKKGPGT